MTDAHDIRGIVLAAGLILAGLTLIARNAGVSLGPWIGPALLIALGLLGLLFPTAWAEWRQGRQARRARHARPDRG